jgi:AhpD family alkylhydroperoxidase
MAATREQVYAEMTQMFGLVPSFFKLVPDNSLELEWRLFKTVQFDEGPIPNKYRELIGIGIAAITKCEYCIQYHTEVARLNGASEAEIEDAVHYAKSSAGWSAYLNGMQVDKQQFADELTQVGEYVRGQAALAAD